MEFFASVRRTSAERGSQDADIISAVEFDRTGDWLATGIEVEESSCSSAETSEAASKQHPEDELEDVLMEEMSSEMQYNRDDQVGVMINNNNDDNNNTNNNASTSGNHRNTTNEQQKLEKTDERITPDQNRLNSDI